MVLAEARLRDRFANWTRDGSARAPSFLGLREDKAPEDCLREEETFEAIPPAPKPHSAVKLSNPGKVLYPRDGITKQQIFDYYTAIAPFMLPHLAGRPLTLQRWPDGIDGEEWYQQNAPEKVPPSCASSRSGPSTATRSASSPTASRSCSWLANLASLTIHQWASHIPEGVTDEAEAIQALAEPDYAILDLDPGDGTWMHLIEVAQAIRALLEALEMPSAVKTSGKRGIQSSCPSPEAERTRRRPRSRRRWRAPSPRCCPRSRPSSG